jgi:DNA polymerase-3 subunit delta'
MDLKIQPWQTAQWQRLTAAEESGRLPHALLLAGPPGTGIGDFAACVAARLLCEKPPAGGVSCGACRPCELFAAGSHPDFFRLDPDPESKSEQIKIEQVRELIHFIHLSRQFTRSRVALACPADAMNRSAANALLKTLEEPPPASVIILVTHRPGNLPVTIRSRCQVVLFHESRAPETVRWLEERLAGKGASAMELLQHARGAPLLAESLAAEGALAQRVAVLDDLLRMRGADADPVPVAERWSGAGAADVLGWLFVYLAESARLKLSGASAGRDASGLQGRLQRLADELDLAALVGFYDAVTTAYRGVTGPNNLSSRSVLEDLIVGWQGKAGRRGG